MNAVSGGHLNVLKWARANGCPWDAGECLDISIAACTSTKCGVDTMVWILSNADLGSFRQTSLVRAAWSVAFRDKAACFEMLLQSHGDTLRENTLRKRLEAGAECARLAQKFSIPLSLKSKARLTEAIERQVTAGVILKHRVQLHRELTLDIFKMAEFCWVPNT